MVISTKQLPHLSPLVDDYFFDYDKVREFYNGDFRELAAFRRQAEDVERRLLPREELASVLKDQNRSYGCGPQTLGHIDKIVRDKAGAVVTGQQVGLFSGPLYTIYKALTAVKLSNHLDRQGLGTFVPIFWLASDDHDLAEIDHITLLDKGNRLEEIRCQMPSGESKIPASNLILPRDVLDCLGQLKDLTLDSEFKTEIIGHLSQAYTPGRSFAEAFALWMTRLFRAQGLILIDASHPRLKEMGRDVFHREIADDSPSTPPALAASDRLRQDGYSPQIPLHEGILNIFYTDLERRAIHGKEGAWGVKGEEAVSRKEQLLAWAREKPHLFSPNVLLRPIYQDALLPTVAYVGGQAEIAYFAQMKGVYETFGLPMPIIYPRKNVTIVEKKVGHILKKYDLKIPDLWSRASEIIPAMAKTQIPESLDKALRLAGDHQQQDFESLKREALAFEPTLQASMDLARGKMDRQLKFLEARILRAAARRNETAVQQLHKAALHLYPNKRLQERVFNIVPFLIKYGYAFMDRLDQEVDIEEHNHQVLCL